MNHLKIQLFSPDTDRFGVTSARATTDNPDDFASISEFCSRNEVKFLVIRIPTGSLKAVQKLESEGFRLMDTLVYYSIDLNKKLIPDDTSKLLIRSIQSHDIEQVKALAEKSFTGYYGHYHADPRLNDDDCDQGYAEWAVRSCTDESFADDVLVTHYQNQLAGFATLRLNNEEEAEGVLFAVAPEAQGMGIYRSFIIQAMNWTKSQDRHIMVVSTQITNIPVQKVWARVGFEMNRSYYTMHKWYSE